MAIETLKALRLSFDRTIPNMAAATPSAIKYGTAPSSHSVNASPQCSMYSEATASF